MKIPLWPPHERPRERLLKHGVEVLADSELLAIMLGAGTRGKSAFDLAHELLHHYQGLRGLLAAPRQSFCQHTGLGDAKYCQLQAALELSRRHLGEGLRKKNTIRCAQDTHEFLIANLRGYHQEVFAGLFLDSQHHVIHFEKLFFGSIRSTSVHPREIIKRALYHNAAAMIIAHNHPSGCVQPSRADIKITRILKDALSMIEVSLLDHIIVGDTQTLSMADFCQI